MVAGAAKARWTALRAPAKLNLGLRVVGRRADGYHELESVFAPLDLGDDVEVGAAEGPREVGLELAGDAAAVPRDGANLAVRAAEGFLEAGALDASVAIRLTKRIPVQAGLGGGSSDAGAVLRALDSLFPEALARDALAALALRLGADVPFFLRPRPAFVSGIGAEVAAIAGVPRLDVVLAHPGSTLSTAEVYAAWDALAVAPSPRAGPPSLERLAALARGESASAAALLRNDLEPAAVRLCPPVARLRTRLDALGARAVGLSGSGPTLFGLFPDAAAARAAAACLEPPVWARAAATVE